MLLVFILTFLLSANSLQAQARITTPKEQFGFNIGDDYSLANYRQLVDYWKKLDRESDRMSLTEIGKTAEGRAMYMAVITAPENQKKLARYMEISMRLARAEGLTDEQARQLAEEGKSVIWIDGGLHATETLGSQQLIELVYQQVSRTDSETLRMLNDTIMLVACSNPDGMDLVADWYMRRSIASGRSLDYIPRLYQKYAGHDNNRDFYMSSLPETEAINRVFYRQWYPQIVYNHHQSGPPGTVMFAPPFRDPFNYHYDPLVITMLEEIGAAMQSRFAVEGKPGVTSRSGSNYSTWWNGGLRTAAYFHNQIGLLTETIGSPTPENIPFVPQNLLARNDLPSPIPPQKWRFRQSVDYSITANRAVLDYAARNKDRLLYNVYQMGRNSIERGSRDTWTDTPHRITELQEAYRGGTTFPASMFEELRRPDARNPRGYIIPSDQADFLTAIKFINALVKSGVDIHRASRQFVVNGKIYPAGSFVVKTAQAYRPHILDMFEPQDHPDDFAYPGADPTPPYDIAGWTLAYQMGVKFDRILDGFDGPFEKLSEEATPPPGKILEVPSPAGYLLSHEPNDSFIAINRLLSDKEEVFWLRTMFTINGKTYPAGTNFIPAKPTTAAKLGKIAREVGLDFEAVATKPNVDALMLRPLRIGLIDHYGGSMPSGWTRLVLERFEFPFSVVYPRTLNAGGLSEKFDVLIFTDGSIPRPGSFPDFQGQPDLEDTPQEYRERLGTITEDRTVPHLERFLHDGGAILAIGGSTSLGFHSKLPVMDALVDTSAGERATSLPRSKLFIPGSILNARVNNESPLAFGFGERVDLFVDSSPLFKLKPDAQGIEPVAWFDTPNPLRSGWASGQKYLEGAIAVANASVGKGKLFLYGPEIVFRSQPHGTFKFLFNGIYYGRSEPVKLSQ